MKYIEICEQIKRLKELILKENTGPPMALAKKIGVSKRVLYMRINTLRASGMEIVFCNKIQSYIFKNCGDNNRA